MYPEGNLVSLLPIIIYIDGMRLLPVFFTPWVIALLSCSSALADSASVVPALGLTAEQDKVPVEPSMKQIALGTVSTSDGIDDRSLIATYYNHRRNLFWAYPDEKEKAWDWGTSVELHEGDNVEEVYHGLKYQLEGARKFSSHFLADLAAGFHRLANINTGVSTNAFAGQVKTDYTPDGETSIELSFSSDYIYPSLIQPGGVTNSIQARSLSLNASERVAPRWRLSNQAQIQFFNDSNQRRHFDLGALYGISTSVPWIWAGVGAEYLSYTQIRADYWTPQRFLAAGPRFEADIPLYGKWSINGGFNLSAFQEGENSWAWGYYTSGKIRYGTRETWYADVGATDIRSTKNGSFWSAYGFNVDLGTAL
jgi:hypothetical protein